MSHDRRLEEQVDWLRRHQAAVVALARRPMDAKTDVQAELAEVCRVAAVTLGVERASLWLLSRDRRDLRALALYELSEDRHSSGTVLTADDYPRYFAALETGRAIPAGDARTDPRTSEFTDGYLVPLGITSMLDAAIRQEGRVIGVVCHEHIGEPRQWTQDEIDFAGALGDRTALVLATAERYKLEEDRDRIRHQLLYTQKLESLGVLAGGMAQEFERLLILISGNAALAREMVAESLGACEPLDEVVSAADRASKLARQLLAYSGRGRVVVEPVDLSAQVAELTELIASSCPRRVRVRFELGTDLSPTKADAIQVQQAVMNLVINGIEAIGSESGEVRVATSMRFLGATEVQSFLIGRSVTPGRYVLLEVEDSGPGFESEVMDRVLDPFFSTKGPGRGLGLSAVMGIVRSHRGALEVSSSPGRGARFRLYFPATDSRVPPAVLRPEALCDGTLLVLDDDDAVGGLARKGLEPLGFEVLTPRGPDEALGRIESDDERLRLILLGASMAGVDVARFTRTLRQGHPHVHVLLLCSYDTREAAAELVAEGIADVIHKPFSSEALARKVRELLGC